MYAETSQSDFVFIGGHAVTDYLSFASRPDIEGVQVVYPWKQLEPRKGVYDFSKIEEDLKTLTALDKKLFVQLQDRFFLPTAKNVPDYLMQDPEYEGGLVRQYDNAGEGKPVGQGWVAKQWNPAVRERFQQLIAELAHQFDGRIYGLNLPESAIDVSDETEAGFNCDLYFEAQLETARFAREAFKQSHVVQYVNFWPCEWADDHGYMSQTFETASDIGFGLGGPDIIPFKKAQMKNSYGFFNEYREKLPLVAMAVQKPTMTYTNPQTGAPFSEDDFRHFADDHLGVDIIFWDTSAPWLNQ
ncbi:hypothetical protein [Tateyamaria omphalii]|uniref:hypothetical protein n=1 Tax=Tateyamaria omphalii TaxID=299262 RepID=UPI001E2C93C8|nr:hypothetical protein [Tateyamaria omphalii]